MALSASTLSAAIKAARLANNPAGTAAAQTGATTAWTSQGFSTQWREHQKRARLSSEFPFHRAIRKHGPESFTHEVLERMTTEPGAKRAEQLWIKELGTFGRGGYNATAGGDGTAGCVGRHVTPETRARMAEAQRGRKHSPETRAKMRGRVKSPEERERIAAGRRGKPLSVEHKATLSKVRQGMLRGRVLSEETKARMSAAQYRRWAK